MHQRLHHSVLVMLMSLSPPPAIEDLLPLDLRRGLDVPLQLHRWDKTRVRKRKRANHIHDVNLTAVEIAELIMPRTLRISIVAVLWDAEAEFEICELRQVLLAEDPAVSIRSGQ